MSCAQHKFTWIEKKYDYDLSHSFWNSLDASIDDSFNDTHVMHTLLLQWNLSNLDTFWTISGVHFMEVSLFQGLVNMQIQHLGPQVCVLNMEVSWFQGSRLARFHCMYMVCFCSGHASIKVSLNVLAKYGLSAVNPPHALNVTVSGAAARRVDTVERFRSEKGILTVLQLFTTCPC